MRRREIRGAEKRKRGEEKRNKGCGEEKKGCGEEKILYFGATVSGRPSWPLIEPSRIVV